MELNERENMLQVVNGKSPEWIPDFGKAAVWFDTPAVGRKKDPKTGFTVDAFGVEFVNTIDGEIPAHTITGRFALMDVTKWRDIMPVMNKKQSDWDANYQAAISRGASSPNLRTEKDKVSNMIGGFLWDELHYLMGIEGAMVALIEEPEACYDFMQAMADYWIEAIKMQCNIAKPDIALIMDHVANASGLLLSPKLFREIIKPAEKRVIKAMLDEGIVPQMHVDGLIDLIIPDYAEMGVKMIQPFQIMNDIEKAKQDYGMICIGGWDAFGPGNLPNTTEEDARQSVRDAIDKYAPTGKYIFWASGLTPKHPERAEWIADEAYKYGHTFYKK